MQSYLNQSVAQAVSEDRVRIAAERRRDRAAVPRPPGRHVRRSAAAVAARIARRLDRETAHRVTTA